MYKQWQSWEVDAKIHSAQKYTLIHAITTYAEFLFLKPGYENIGREIFAYLGLWISLGCLKYINGVLG